MADEYSDEEFAPDDADAAYDAEFDDDDDKPLSLDEADAPTEAADAYQESYDAEFDPPDADEQPAEATEPVVVPPTDSEAFTPAPDDQDDQEKEESHRSDDADDVDKLKVEVEDPPVLPAAPSTSKASPGLPEASVRLGMVDGALRPMIRGRRFSEPMASMTTRVSIDVQMIEALPEIERCADPVLQAKLTRRSSSPRVRPAPIARLPSVEELCAAAPEELQVPTNAITEEAAAIANAATSDSTSPRLAKRSSSSCFVPRLPSLLESLDVSAPLTSEQDGSQSHKGDESEDSQDDKDDNDDEGELHDREPQNHSTVQGSNDDGNEHTDDEYATEPRNCDQAIKNSMPSDSSPSGSTSHASDRDKDLDSAEEGVIRDCGSEQVARAVSDHNEGVSEEIGTAGSSAATSYRSSPSPSSEHLLDDDIGTDLPSEEAEVLRAAGVKMGATQNPDDDINYNVDPDDDHRRETQQLLQEVDALISQQTNQAVSVEPGVDVSKHLVQLDEGDPSERYREEDQFSDAEYDDDEELVEGAYYDSERDEAVQDFPAHAAQPTAIAPSVSSEQSNNTTQIQTVITEQEAPQAVKKGKQPQFVSVTTTTQSSPTPTSKRQAPATKPKPTRTPQPPTSPATRVSVQISEPKPGVSSNELMKEPRRPKPSVPIKVTPKPDVPTLTPKAPVPRQMASTPSQSHRVAFASATVDKTSRKSGPADSTRQAQPQERSQRPASPTKSESVPTRPASLGRAGLDDQSLPPRKEPVFKQIRSQETSQKRASPTKSDSGATRPSSPVREVLDDRPSSPRKAPVFKQKRAPKPTNPEETKKKLKPVKCPPNLRVDLPHVDKEKREWLLLNMFRHGDNIDKYDPFIPTATPEQTIELHLPVDALKRPLSATQFYGEAYQLPRQSSSRSYGRHSGRKIVDRPVDPRVAERERSWVSSTPSVSVIPLYDSILDKYCKTVTSPVVQRRIYETRMDDLSPQLAMVLEKRAFKEWKHSESEGFGAVSNSYKTAIVAVKSSSTASTKALHTPRPPSTTSVTTTSVPDA